MDATIVVILIFLLAGVLIGLGLGLSRRSKRQEAVPGEVRTRPTPTAPPKVAPPVVAPVEPEVETPPEVEVEVEAPPELRERLGKTRGVFARLRGRNRIDDETWDDLEDTLLMADVGMPATDGSRRRQGAGPGRADRRPDALMRCSTPSWWRCSTTARSRARSATPTASRTCGCSSA